MAGSTYVVNQCGSKRGGKWVADIIIRSDISHSDEKWKKREGGGRTMRNMTPVEVMPWQWK